MRTLRSILVDSPRLPESECCRIGAGIAQALAVTHAAGHVHRNVTPETVMVGGDQVRLYHIDPSAGVFGTPMYAAPEMFTPGKSDGRADLFALGCLLYRMATGAPAFDSEELSDLIEAILNTEPTPLRQHAPDCSAAFEALVHDLLKKDPDHRPDSAEVVARVLGDGESPVDYPVSNI